MKLGKAINIAVFVAGLDEEYQNNIISGINEFSRRNNINVSYFAAFGGMIDSRPFDIGEYSIYSLANLEKFDGAKHVSVISNRNRSMALCFSRFCHSVDPAGAV